MKFHLHFIILATCLPSFIYSQTGPRRDGPILTTDLRSDDVPTLYLDPRRTIVPSSTYTGTYEPLTPYERRYSGYFEDDFDLERPPSRPLLRRRRPFPRIVPLGRRYGRRTRRPPFPSGRRRLAPRAERRRPFYDPYYREFEPRRRGRRYRPRRRMRLRPRLLRSRDRRRRGPREYYPRDGGDEYRPRDDLRRERRLEDGSYVRTSRRRIFDSSRRIRPRVRMTRRRVRPLRDRALATELTEERPYVDETTRSISRRRLRLDTPIDFGQDGFVERRLPYERLSDRMLDTLPESALPRYDTLEGREVVSMDRPGHRRETSLRTTDVYDVPNSFDGLNHLNRGMTPREERNNSTTVKLSYNEIIRQSPGEKLYPQSQNTESTDSRQSLIGQKEADVLSHPDGFLHSSGIANQAAKTNVDIIPLQLPNADPHSNKQIEPAVMSETVELTVSPIEINDRETINKIPEVSPLNINGTYTIKPRAPDAIPDTTIKIVKPPVSNVVKEKMHERVVGSANVLSRQHPKFLKIPVEIPHSSIVIDLADENKNTPKPVLLTTTEEMKVVLNILDTHGTVKEQSNEVRNKNLKPKYSLHAVNNSISVINENIDIKANLDKSNVPVIETNVIAHETSLGSRHKPKTSDALISAESTFSGGESKPRPIIRPSKSPAKQQDINAIKVRRPTPINSTRKDDALMPDRAERRRSGEIISIQSPTNKTSDDPSVSGSDILLTDIPLRDGRPAHQSRRISSRRGYIDDLSVTDHVARNRERPFREDSTLVRRRMPERRRYREELSVSEEDRVPIERTLRDEPRRRRPVRRLVIDEGQMAEDDILSERPFIDDLTPRGRRVLSPERYSDELALTEDDGLFRARPLGYDRSIARLRRPPSGSTGEGLSSSPGRAASETLPRRRRFPVSDSGELPDITRRPRTRRLLREDGAPIRSRRLTPIKDRIRDVPRDEMPVRRRRPKELEERFREVPRREEPVRRRRLPSSSERPREERPLRRSRFLSTSRRLRDLPIEDEPYRRRRPPPVEERLRDLPLEGEPLMRRRLSLSEERSSDILPEDESRRRRRMPLSDERLVEFPPEDEPLRGRRLPPLEERHRDMLPGDEPRRRRRMPPSKERLRALVPDDEPVRLRRLPPEERMREILPDDERRRRFRLPPSEERLRDLPPDDEPVRRRRPEERIRDMLPDGARRRRLRLPPSEEALRDLPPDDELVRRRRLPPPKERLRDEPRIKEAVRGHRRLRPLKVRSESMSLGEEPIRLRRPPSSEESLVGPRGRRPISRERSRRREYVPARRRESASDRQARDESRPRIEETFVYEPVISRRRLRPRERPRLETDDSPVTSVRQEERDRGIDVSTDETTSTLAPMESVTERLRLGAVRARGGEHGYPVHGGYCPGERCADGGLAAGVQNGTGTGTLELFLERKRTGTNEDIAAYERDLRPRRTRTTLVV